MTSISSMVAAHLPSLRRYARALTGAQSSGDAYVAALLEALIAEPELFDRDADARVQVYTLMSRMWSSLRVNTQNDGLDRWEQAASRKLEAITPRARQAFLLASVEGFSLPQIGQILGASESEVATLLGQAGSEIAQQVHSQVMIIEDEPLIALEIETLVAELGHDVTGVARTHKEAIRLAGERSPGLILADIQLADGSSGIDAVNELIRDFDVPVVFITAFPERLLTGEKPEPAFLISKPFVPDMVKAVISQALFFEQTAGSRSAA